MHVTSSVGWLGAVAGLTSQDVQIVRAAYLAMELIGWFVIVLVLLFVILHLTGRGLGSH